MHTYIPAAMVLVMSEEKPRVGDVIWVAEGEMG